MVLSCSKEENILQRGKVTTSIILVSTLETMQDEDKYILTRLWSTVVTRASSKFFWNVIYVHPKRNTVKNATLVHSAHIYSKVVRSPHLLGPYSRDRVNPRGKTNIEPVARYDDFWQFTIRL